MLRITNECTGCSSGRDSLMKGVGDWTNMNQVKCSAILVCLGIFVSTAAVPSARALTANLFPVADATLRNNDPDSPVGDANPLLVGVSKSPFTVTNRMLLKFDFSGIPTNATVTGVTLTLTIFRSNTGPANGDLNRLLVDWNEYEVTWNDRKASTPWHAGGAESGTEFVPAASVTTQIDETIFSSPGMVADVQLWVDNPGTNYGWIMMATGEPEGTGKQIGSRESDYSPILVVDYTLSPPAASPVLFGMAASESAFHFSLNTQSNLSYSIEFRDSLGDGDWNLLTNIPAQPADAIITVTNPVSSATRYFRARVP